MLNEMKSWKFGLYILCSFKIRDTNITLHGKFDNRLRQFSKKVLERYTVIMWKMAPPLPNSMLRNGNVSSSLPKCCNIDWWGEGKGRSFLKESPYFINPIYFIFMLMKNRAENSGTLCTPFQGLFSRIVGHYQIVVNHRVWPRSLS